jgi:hypothetical protein
VRQQFLLSLIAQGLVMTTFENFTPDRALVVLPWPATRPASWCWTSILDRCAARAAPASNPFAPPGLLPESPEPLDPGRIGRSTGRAVGSRRRAANNGPVARTTQASNYSASKKRKVCDALGADWAALAPASRFRNRNGPFRSGRKPYAVWEWIEREGRLHELPQALRDLGLRELADVLDGDGAMTQYRIDQSIPASPGLVVAGQAIARRVGRTLGRQFVSFRRPSENRPYDASLGIAGPLGNAAMWPSGTDPIK